MCIEKSKTIALWIVIVLFFSIAVSPVISDENAEINQHKLTIIMKGVTHNNYQIEAKISKEQLNEFNNSLNDCISFVNDMMAEDSFDGENITTSEWIKIKYRFNELIDLIKKMIGDDFPDEETKVFVNSVIKLILSGRFLFRQPVFSIGIGITWIPFYEYETLIGKIFKPIFIQHLLGFSATFKLNPFVVGFPCIKFGLHRVRTFFFEGLLINFGELGIERTVGPQILIGFGFFTGFA